MRNARMRSLTNVGHMFARVERRYRSIPSDLRYNEDGIEPALQSFRATVDAQAERCIEAGTA